MDTKRICKRCWIEGLPMPSFYADMKKQIERLDPDVKVSEAEYEKRLVTCDACEHLLSGMCKKCGCFVEWRAATINNHCPDVPARW